MTCKVFQKPLAVLVSNDSTKFQLENKEHKLTHMTIWRNYLLKSWEKFGYSAIKKILEITAKSTNVDATKTAGNLGVKKCF